MSELKPNDTGNTDRDSQGRWVKGVSGNYAGRPKNTLSLTSLLKAKLLESVIDNEGNLITNAQRIVNVLFDMAISKDLRAITELLNRVEGLPDRANNFNDDDIINKVEVTVIRPEKKDESNKQ